MKSNELQTAEKKKVKPYEYKKATKPILKPKSEKSKRKAEIITERKDIVTLKESKEQSKFIPPKVEKFTITIKKTKAPVFKPKDESAKDIEESAIVSELIAKKNVEKHLKDSIESFLEPHELAILLNIVDEMEEIRLKTDFNSSFAPVRPFERSIHVPKVGTDALPEISVKTDFDKSLPEMSPVRATHYIPELSVEETPKLTIRSEFETAIHIDLPMRSRDAEQTAGEIPDEASKKDVEEITTKETLAVAESTSGELENLFDFIIKPSYGRFSELSPDRPIVLLLPKFEDDSYSATLQIICREIFREIVGGFPEARRISEEEKDKFEDLRAENRIEFVDESATKYFKSDLDRFKSAREWPNYLDWNKIRNRLNELYAQGFGFIIFHVPEDLINDFEKKIKEISGDLEPLIIRVMPKIVGNHVFKGFIGMKIDSERAKDIKRKISSAVWGFVVPRGDEKWERGETFDNFFGACERAFYEKLRKIGESDIKVKGNGKEKRIPVDVIVNSGENESRLHFYMKVFVVKYLIEKLGYSKDNIKTEEDARIDDIIPDIRAGRDIVIEIETLYGTGRPLSKITDTIKKYKGKNVELWIVVKNFDAVLYYKDLMKRAKSVKEEFGIDVKFFTLDVERLELVSLEDLKKYIKSVIKDIISEIKVR